MRKVQIITDTCCDLTPELMEQYGIDYARMNTVYEGKESPAELSWTPTEVHEFYENIRKGGRYTTTQVPVEEYDRIFRKYLEQGSDIVYIACSTKQSGSVNTAKVLAKKLEAEYGSGFSKRQLEFCRQFFITYPIANTVCSQLNP